MDRFAGPLALAVIVTLANAVKPVVVDDTAYLAYARHISQHPLDPYGFTFHWYASPEPAMDVLVPPVLPYWFALGMRLFGENIFLLKLWLFPLLWLLTASLDVLLRRFARGTERIALPLIVLSPAVLPTVNLMLDIPAAALGLAALAVFTRSPTREQGNAHTLARASGFWRAILAGVLAGLAMQTKYTGMLAPAAIAWYGITHRQIRLAILACALAVGVFVGWEALLSMKYGESHFLHHFAEQRAAGGNWLEEKSALIPGLVGHLGLLGFGIALYSARLLGLSSRLVVAFAILWSVGFLLVLVESGESLRARNVWRPAGTEVLLAATACVGMSFGRWRARKSYFVAGWLVLEVAGYFLLTPFPAARRVIGITIAFGVLAARIASRVQRVQPRLRPPKWVLPFGIAVGFLTAALDAFDAVPEKAIAERAAEVVRQQNPPRVWFAGHWGFHFYCEREGFTMLVPGQTVLQPGDMLVLPLYPGQELFYRPHLGFMPVQPPADRVELLAILEWEDVLSGKTVPNFYGGSEPIEGRKYSRIRVGVYRMEKPWIVPRK